MVTKMGAVKPRAVTWAIGIRVMAKNQSMTPMPCRTPRKACTATRRPGGGRRKTWIRLGARKRKPKR